MLIFKYPNTKSYHPTSVLPLLHSKGQQTKVPVYQVNGASLTYAEVAQVAPEQRTVAHWQVLLDWERQRTQPYVIVDPFDPSGLLYFSEVEYKIQARTLGSMNTPFIVVARPGSTRVEPKITPAVQDGLWKRDLFESFDPISWRALKDLRHFIERNVKWDKAGAVRVNDRNIMGLVWLWSRELFHQLGENGWAKRQGQFTAFVRHFQNILRVNGSSFAIQRLKITLFVLYSWLGGNPLNSTQELGQRIRLRNGLPTWLPRNALRRSKRTGLRTIRLWASLLNIYKYMSGEHPTPPLDTIMAEKFSGSYSDFRDFAEQFPKLIKREFNLNIEFAYETAKGLVIRKAGANHATSMLSIPADSFAWSQQPVNWPLEWFNLWGDTEMADLMSRVKSQYDPKCRSSGVACNFCLCKPRTGRLHPIEEAAGKVRVVAICDYFTQVALEPVHNFLFGILRNIPTDATFDQQGRVDEFAARGYEEIFSYDLKAATDLIPIELYELVMREFFQGYAAPAWGEGRKGNEPPYPLTRAKVYAAQIWRALLTDRTFFAEPKLFGVPAKDEMAPEGFNVRYTRGQPMGALSSWAALAMLHHALVQFAAQRVRAEGARAEWFSDYLVLGDDIVIANEQVALSYLEVCSNYGIKVGLAKSLVSREGLMNFANQTLLRNENVSPLSLREELSAQNFPMRTVLADRIFHRWGGDRTGLQWVKRVLTEPQWSAISDGGIRGAGRRNLDLVRFLLENPLVTEGVTSGNVLSWLGLIDPELRKLPNELRLEFDRVLKAYCLQDLVRGVQKRLNDMAAERNHIRNFLYERPRPVNVLEMPPVGNAPEDLPSVIYLPPIDADPSVKREVQHPWGRSPWRGFRQSLQIEHLYGLDGPAFVEYLLESLEASLDRTVWSQLKKLRKEIRPYMYRDYVHDDGSVYWPADGPSLEQLIFWHGILSYIPRVRFEKGADPERTLFALFRALPDAAEDRPPARRSEFVRTVPKETIKGPVLAVTKAIVKVFGIVFPIDALLTRDTSSITRMLRHLRALQLGWWSVRDASPCKATMSMALVRVPEAPRDIDFTFVDGLTLSGDWENGTYLRLEYKPPQSQEQKPRSRRGPTPLKTRYFELEEFVERATRARELKKA